MRTLKTGHYEMRPLNEFKVTRKIAPWKARDGIRRFSKEDVALLDRIYPKINR